VELSLTPRLQVGKFAFMANCRARTVEDTDGMVKFVSDAKTDKILGAHIMGPNAGGWARLSALSLTRLGAASAGCKHDTGYQPV